MEKIINDLIKNQKEIIKESFPYTFVKQIIRLDSDKLFKGHNGSVAYGQYEDESAFINVSNKYYNVILMNQYYFQNKETIITAIIDTKMTKYFRSFLSNLTEKGKYTLTFNDEDDIMFKFDNHNFTVIYTYKYNGFIPFNHSDNIKIVNSIKNVIRRFMGIVRENGENPDFYQNIRFIKGDKVFLSKELFK